MVPCASNVVALHGSRRLKSVSASSAHKPYKQQEQQEQQERTRTNKQQQQQDTTPQHTTPSTLFLLSHIQAHFIPSGTRLAHEYQDTCFLHDANMLAQQGLGHGHGPRTLALRASQGRVYRESQLDERPLSSSWRRERES